MSYRRTPLVIGEYYHVFNRGVARQPTFLSRFDYKYALESLAYYQVVNPVIPLSRFRETSEEDRGNYLDTILNMPRYVDIVAFVFMPNHFHMLLKQNEESGVSTFLSKFTNSYTRYFNVKHQRVGPLFQGRFKSVHIETTEQLLHVSRYIHLNPLVSGVVREEEVKRYEWSSLSDYLQASSKKCVLLPVLETFPKGDYEKFVMDHASYAQELEKIKHLTLE